MNENMNFDLMFIWSTY